MSGNGSAEPVSRWRAGASPGGLIGILGVVLSLLLAGGALLAALGRTAVPAPSVALWSGAALFLALAALLAYLTYGYLTIGYELGEQALVIRWAHRRWQIDLSAITYLGPAADVLEEHPGRWQRFWPGYYVGSRRGPKGRVRVVATLPLSRQLLIATADRAFAISPERPVLFVEEYGRLRRRLDLQRTGGFPTVERGEGARRLASAGWTMEFPALTLPPRPTFDELDDANETAPGPSQRAALAAARSADVSPALRPLLLADRVALAVLAVAVLLDVLLVGYILLQYDRIPPTIALHWNVNGLPDRIGSPREIWTLPLITGIVTIANFGLAWSVESFDRFAARLLLGATCLVQVFAWVAVVTLIH